jgi:hypothetical protein
VVAGGRVIVLPCRGQDLGGSALAVPFGCLLGERAAEQGFQTDLQVGFAHQGFDGVRALPRGEVEYSLIRGA